MLVILRGIGEETYIHTASGTITVKILSIPERTKVRLGFDAPKAISIVRDNAKDRKDQLDESIRNSSKNS